MQGTMQGTDPVVVAELRRLSQENDGVLTPEAVVEAARPEDSVLHGKFEWEDSTAAHNWRLFQARNLLRVVVIYIGPPTNQICTPVFVSLTPDRINEGGGYREIETVLSSAEQREQLLADAVEEMRCFRRKYATLKELEQVFRAMRRVRRAA